VARAIVAALVQPLRGLQTWMRDLCATFRENVNSFFAG